MPSSFIILNLLWICSFTYYTTKSQFHNQNLPILTKIKMNSPWYIKIYCLAVSCPEKVLLRMPPNSKGKKIPPNKMKYRYLSVLIFICNCWGRCNYFACLKGATGQFVALIASHTPSLLNAVSTQLRHLSLLCNSFSHSSSPGTCK